MHALRAAARAILAQLQALRIVFLVLLGDVIPRLALVACQRDDDPILFALGGHSTVLQLVVWSVPSAATTRRRNASVAARRSLARAPPPDYCIPSPGRCLARPARRGDLRPSRTY